MDTILGSSINLRQGKTWYDGSQMKDFKDRASIIEMINGHEPMTIILVQLGYEDPYSHPIQRDNPSGHAELVKLQVESRGLLKD